MHSVSIRAAAVAVLAMTFAVTCRAESFASSASSAGSASIGSLSDSIKGSSNSSAGDNKVAEGDYRIVEVAALAEKPGMLRLKMQAAARAGAEGELWLDLPQKALAARDVAAGDTVTATQRPYGFEFAHADTHQAFFLVLADDWRRELDSHAL